MGRSDDTSTMYPCRSHLPGKVRARVAAEVGVWVRIFTKDVQDWLRACRSWKVCRLFARLHGPTHVLTQS